jgi:hypothetical protein
MLMTLRQAAEGFLRLQTDFDPQAYGGGGDQGGMIAALAGGVGGLIGLVLLLVMLASLWKIFTKAGEPGWAAIVPIYNLVVLLKIVGKPLWWIILFLIPCANIIAGILLTIELAKVFGKGIGFAVGMILLGIVFYPLLAFGDAEYTPPSVA